MTVFCEVATGNASTELMNAVMPLFMKCHGNPAIDHPIEVSDHIDM